jgi:4-amino-4-deoxy-L-arabinose transferase-like glycosyltransferase
MLAFIVRAHDYALAPGLVDVPAEYSTAWNGVQLLTGHGPTGVSNLAAYAGRGQDIQFFGKTFHLVSPYLDHPPLFGLLSGGAELLSGVTNFSGLTPGVMRRPSLVLGVLAVILGYFLARRLLPPIAALLAAFLLAVEPAMVALSRVALPEALLTPMLLGAILLATPGVPETTRPGSAGAGPAPDQAPGRWLLGALVVLCALAPLVELSGLIVPITASALLLSRGLRRQGLVAAAAGAGGLVLFLIYGLALDGRLLLTVLSEKAAGGGGVLTPMTFVTASIGAGKPMIDAWYLFAWAALAYLAGNAKRRHRFRAVLWPVIGYVAILTPFLPAQDLTLSGWYRLPILPLLLVGAFGAVYAAVREGQVLVPGLALLSAGVWSIQWLFGSDWKPGAVALLILAVVALLPMAASEVRTRGSFRDAGQGVWVALGLLVLGGDIALSWNLVAYAGRLG